MDDLDPALLARLLEQHRVVWIDPEPAQTSPHRLTRRYLLAVEGRRPRVWAVVAYRHPNRGGQWMPIAHGQYLDLPPEDTAQQALAAAEAWLAAREGE